MARPGLLASVAPSWVGTGLAGVRAWVRNHWPGGYHFGRREVGGDWQI